MTWRLDATKLLRAWVVGALGWWLAGVTTAVLLSHLVCDVLHSDTYGCRMGESSTLLASLVSSFARIFEFKQWPWNLAWILALISVSLLLSQPGRYLVRERGVVFEALLGGCCGALYAICMVYVGQKEWRRALSAWCEGHDLACDVLILPYLLFWLAYWTLLPALLAAGLMRAGRALMRCIGRARARAT